MFRATIWQALGAAALLACNGCGRGMETIPVAGIATLDGQPVADAGILFLPVAGGRPASATTDAAGRFELSTLDPGDGAIPGEHRVTVNLLRLTNVEQNEQGEMIVLPGGTRTEWIVPERYSKAETSGLVVEVKSGMNAAILNLTTSP